MVAGLEENGEKDPMVPCIINIDHYQDKSAPCVTSVFYTHRRGILPVWRHGDPFEGFDFALVLVMRVSDMNLLARHNDRNSLAVTCSSIRPMTP